MHIETRAHLSLLCLEVLSARPLGPETRGSRTTTWGLSRKHQPLWTPTCSLLSWITTALRAASDPGCFWRSSGKKDEDDGGSQLCTSLYILKVTQYTLSTKERASRVYESSRVPGNIITCGFSPLSTAALAILSDSDPQKASGVSQVKSSSASTMEDYASG